MVAPKKDLKRLRFHLLKTFDTEVIDTFLHLFATAAATEHRRITDTFKNFASDKRYSELDREYMCQFFDDEHYSSTSPNS